MNLLVDITITVPAFLSYIILALVLGFILQLPSVYKYKIKLENLLLKLHPPPSYFKMMAVEKLKMCMARKIGNLYLPKLDGRHNYFVQKNVI